jgi:poly-gamma-glutamate synthesis protein (capsule biosynthesis protein)
VNGGRLVAVGDIFLDRPDPRSAFAATAGHLRGFDLAFGNVEAPISLRGELRPWSSKFPLRMRPAMIDGLADAGFGVVSLANNHTMDWSTDALLDSIGALRERGIVPIGAGRNLAEARRPAILERRGLRIGMLAFQATEHDRPDIGAKHDTPGLNQLRLSAFYPDPRVNPSDIAAMRDSIRALRTTVDLVVASFHWGVAGSIDLTLPQLALAKEAAGAGADLVVGHHAHVPQAVALIGRCVVAFGLGNFAFDWDFPHFVPGRLVLECDFDPRGIRRALIRPATADADRVPHLLAADTGLGRAICEGVLAASAPFGDAVRLAPERGGLVVAVP